MTLFIDVENKKLVQSLTSDRSVPAPVFMQGDNEPLEIFLLQKGAESLYEVKPLVVGTDFLRVAIARFKGYPILKRSAETESIKTTFPRFFCPHFTPPQPRIYKAPAPYPNKLPILKSESNS